MSRMSWTYRTTPVALIMAFLVLTGIPVAIMDLKNYDDSSRAAYAAEGEYVIEGAERVHDGPGKGKKKKISLDEPISADDLKKMKVQKEKGDLHVPKVGLNARMRSMNVVRGVINPPSLYSAYRVRGYGKATPDSKKMTVVAMHSIRGVNSVPGTKLINVSKGTSRVGPGDDVYVLGQRYKIYRVDYPKKVSAPKKHDLWDDKPGKLLLITCLQRPSGRSIKNVFIQAYMVDNDTGKPIHSDVDYLGAAG